MFQTVQDDDGKHRWKLGDTVGETSHETAAGATLEFSALAAEGRIEVKVLPKKTEENEEENE